MANRTQVVYPVTYPAFKRLTISVPTENALFKASSTLLAFDFERHVKATAIDINNIKNVMF